MQQLTRDHDTERGASAVLVALLMVPILGFAALAVDVGALYAERAQLQNGADAAALGVAQACARGAATCAAYDAGSRVTGAVNTNDAYDSLETLQSVSFPNGANTSPVTVTTSTRTTGGGVALVNPFASVLGIPTTQVTATATASWSSASSGTVTLPLAFSLCGLQSALAGGTKQLLRSDQNASVSDPSCSATDGHPISGGFGWLADVNGQCSAFVTADSLVSSDQGNDLPSRCSSLLSPPDQLTGRILEVPVFDCAQNTAGTCLVDSHGTSNVSKYHIYGFAAFLIEGHRLSGSDTATNSAYTGQLACNGNCRGLQGKFVYWSFPGGGGSAPGPNLGANSVKLTN